MKCTALALGALVALGSVFAFSQAANAATALNGAKLDPLNLIDDRLENEALASYARHAVRQPFKGDEIVIVDYAKPSSSKRLYIVNIRTGAVEAHYVAHGRGSDPNHSNMAVRFSDAETSGMSSVGAFRGLERYKSPSHGAALKLTGLDATNASAYRRLIVFHTAAYFDPENGRYGRSCGCFVVTKGDMTRVYDVIADGGFLYAGPASMHDPSASTAADCNTACGNTCPNAPLMAKATPVPRAPAAAVMTAKAEPPPAPVAPAREAAPVVMAALKAEPTPMPKTAKPDFNAPVPLAKPKFAAPVELASFEAPVPRLKPALDAETIDGDARVAALEVLNHRNAPRLVARANRAAPAEMAVAAFDAPVPMAKPALIAGRDVAPQIASHPLVPDVAPGETPVPSAKPPALRQTADAGGRS